MRFVLKEKLKGLKASIKAWNKEEYGGMVEGVERLVEDIRGIDELGEEGRLNEEQMERRKLKFVEL